MVRRNDTSLYEQFIQIAGDGSKLGVDQPMLTEEEFAARIRRMSERQRDDFQRLLNDAFSNDDTPEIEHALAAARNGQMREREAEIRRQLAQVLHSLR